MAKGLDVAMAGLQVGYENPAQFSANTAVCLAHRVHMTSPRRLPRGAAARMDACNEAWQKGPAGQSREAAVRALSTPAGDYRV